MGFYGDSSQCSDIQYPISIPLIDVLRALLDGQGQTLSLRSGWAMGYVFVHIMYERLLHIVPMHDATQHKTPPLAMDCIERIIFFSHRNYFLLFYDIMSLTFLHVP